MALIRRLDIIEYKEVTVEYPPMTEGAFGTLYENAIYIDRPDGLEKRIVITNNAFYDITNTYSSKGVLRVRGSKNDSDNDNIPDYLDYDVDDDGTADGGADFEGVVKRTFLLGKVVLWDCTDDGTRTVEEIYNETRTNVLTRTSPDFLKELSYDLGWIILGESKPSFFYEKCLTNFSEKTYSGRLPVSINYFDLNDLWIRKSQNLNWQIVSGDIPNPIETISEFNINGQYTPLSQMMQTGFDWSFGPKLSQYGAPQPWKQIQEYFRGAAIVNLDDEYYRVASTLIPVTRINAKAKPVNLLSATRNNFTKILGVDGKYQEGGEYSVLTDSSQKAGFVNTFPSPDKELVEIYYGYDRIPDIIPFDDSREKFGIPNYAILNGFLVNGEKFTGECVPVPYEESFLDEEDSDILDSKDYRTRVTIADVLTGKEKLDGTNYIRGTITAYFTFPMKATQNSDLDNLHFNVVANPEIYNRTAHYLSETFPDPYTNLKEMRNVVFIQDETAGMELLGTDFYSRAGLEFKGTPEPLQLSGWNKIATLSGTPSSIEGYQNVYDTYTTTISPPAGFAGPPRVIKTDVIVDRKYDDEPTAIETEFDINANIPANSYWETDTAYVPDQRYHFKVGDFIEVYNLDLLNRSYAPKACKIVNGEYRIIPNNAPDIDDYLDKNVIANVNLHQLRYDYNRGLSEQQEQVSNMAKYISYDYKPIIVETTDKNGVKRKVSIDSIFRYDNCLVRIKDVAFAKADSFAQPNQLFYNAYSSLMENDTGPFYLEGDYYDFTGSYYTGSKETEYWGYRFEPCKRVMIRDVGVRRNPETGERYRDFEFGNTDHKAFVFIPCSTEMAENMMPIPGRPTIGPFAKDKTKVNPDYLKWKAKNSGSVDFETTYNWPLEIIGILRRTRPGDASVYGGDFYEIWPRRYQDLGITPPTKKVNINIGDNTNDGGGTPTGGRGGGRGGGTTPSNTGGVSTCFPSYTNILTPNGYIQISEISVGDLVMTFDENLNIHQRPVVRKYTHDGEEKSDVYRYLLSNGKSLDITENHPILTRNGFIQIGQLNINDHILDYNNNEIIILSKEFLFNDTVYNIEVDEYNAYIAEDICVHNLTKGYNLERLDKTLEDIIRDSLKDAPDPDDYIDDGRGGG